MKDYLIELVRGSASDPARTNVVREYLQARILQAFQESGVFTRWALLGGAALRFLYSMTRYSEDLDFSTIQGCGEPGFKPALNAARSALKREGYIIEIKVKDEKTVCSAFLRFPGILYDLGISLHRAQVISVKVELDTQPPVAAGFETTLVRRHVLLNLNHYDKPSLLAGKLHAILSRPWTKGRDLYDLIWYLSDRTWPAPNLLLLNAALSQTGWAGQVLTADNWRGVLRERLSRVDWTLCGQDVAPLLENAREVDLLVFDNVARLL